MPAYYLAFQLRERLAPLLFADGFAAHTLTQPTNPTALQTRIFELLNLRP